MPTVSYDRNYWVEIFVKGGWRRNTEPTASLGFVEKQYWEHVDQYGQDNVRCIVETNSRATYEFQKRVDK